METLIQFLKMLVKGAMLFVGGLLLLGGGACALIGVGNLGRGAVIGVLTMVGMAIGVAAMGWGLIKSAKTMGQVDSESAMSKEESARIGKLVLVLMAVAIVVAISLSILQALLH